MRLFAVRLMEHQQAVGFFWAPDRVALWWMVDSVCDPGLCEFVRVRDRAALVWNGKTSLRFADRNLHADNEDDNGDRWERKHRRHKGEMSFEYALEDFIFGFKTGDWEKLPYADEPEGGIADILAEVANDKRSKTRSNRSTKSGSST